jgi:hypothetical protein
VLGKCSKSSLNHHIISYVIFWACTNMRSTSRMHTLDTHIFNQLIINFLFFILWVYFILISWLKKYPKWYTCNLGYKTSTVFSTRMDRPASCLYAWLAIHTSVSTKGCSTNSFCVVCMLQGYGNKTTHGVYTRIVFWLIQVIWRLLHGRKVQNLRTTLWYMSKMLCYT